MNKAVISIILKTAVRTQKKPFVLSQSKHGRFFLCSPIGRGSRSRSPFDRPALSVVEGLWANGLWNHATAVFRIMVSVLFALSIIAPPVWAYGGGGGGAASCAEAKFYDEAPARNSVLPSLSDFSLVASDNTDLSTLELSVNGKPMKPEISQRRSGEFDLKIHLPEPINEAGKVRITLEAKSKEGCSTFFPYYLEIRK